ncbi:cation diffusion facilitator family transporter [Croceibacterium aestuarii]|uniref:cation diffusion facilitator family transporter n=1 Tax=Croceibacterium aestuarii TaxID=3064139 RepID=UPI00272EA12A|nr:cation diffusion facilitator family transporter [Croceibacterium sp. D39]
MASGGKLVLFAALGANFAIAAAKFTAAAVAGSSSMLTEGIHSLVDSGNQLLMLHGRKRAKIPPDDNHPLGHGREVYFWGFVVALLIFTGGAGMSIYEGYVHIRNPEMLSRPLVNFAVLGVAAVAESISLVFAVREFLAKKKREEGWWEAVRSSKDPTIFVVLMEDSAALAGLFVAAAFIGLTLLTGNPVWDGIGSVIIGLILGGVAILLATESKKLLLGEQASPEVRQSIRNIAGSARGVCQVNDVITIHLAPEQVVVLISLDFEDDLPIDEVEGVTEDIERRTRAHHPQIFRFFVRAQSRAAAEAEREKVSEAATNPIEPG